MTTRTATLEASLRTISDSVGIAPRTVIALPPSDLDPAEDEMRVRVGVTETFAGAEIIREYDPELEQP